MTYLLAILLIVCFLVLPFTGSSQGHSLAQGPDPKNTSVTHKAPIVFLGRPVEVGFYQADGLIYRTTLFEVLDVLRGSNYLTSGFVEVVDSLAAQDAAVKSLYTSGITAISDIDEWGVYFCSPSSYAPNQSAYQTGGNRPIRLFASTGMPFIRSRSTDHGRQTTGFNQSFADEKEVITFLSSIPELKPIAKPIHSYPRKPFPYTRLEKGR